MLTTPWSEIHPGFCTWGTTPSLQPRLVLARKAATLTNFSEASPAPCTKGPAGMRGSGAGGRALLLLMWQSFPAEGRQNAHDSFFQEMLQTIVTMPLVGMNVKRHDGGAAMLGTLCVGCQRRVLPRTKPAGASFWHCVRPEPFCKDFGEEGQNGCPANSSPRGILSACDGYQPHLQPKRALVLFAHREKWQKQSQKVPSPCKTGTRTGREFRKALQCFKAVLPQLLPLPSTQDFHIQMLP